MPYDKYGYRANNPSEKLAKRAENAMSAWNRERGMIGGADLAKPKVIFSGPTKKQKERQRKARNKKIIRNFVNSL
jgi:hypothetical protein